VISARPGPLPHLVHHRTYQSVEVASHAVADFVKEEGRSPGDTARLATGDIAEDSFRMDSLVHLVGEAVEIEIQLPGVPHQRFPIEVVLVAEQDVMHLPELPLLGGCLGGLRSLLRVIVPDADWEVPEHEPKLAVE